MSKLTDEQKREWQEILKDLRNKRDDFMEAWRYFEAETDSALLRANIRIEEAHKKVQDAADLVMQVLEDADGFRARVTESTMTWDRAEPADVEDFCCQWDELDLESVHPSDARKLEFSDVTDGDYELPDLDQIESAPTGVDEL